MGLLVVYLFNRNDYPWVGYWEESYNRVHAPWKGHEFCRGFEFSTTPFPIPRRATVTNGPLFDECTYRWLPARAKAKSKYRICLFDVPQDFQRVAAIKVDRGSLLLQEKTKSRVLHLSARSLL